MRSLIVTLFIALPLAAQTPNVDEIFSAYAKPDTPGCAVGVARAGEVLLERGYGMANLEFDAPITPATIFEAGSVTKQFTAQAIVLLARDGKLSLDDRVVKYIPELDASAKDITIRQMLTHTSGLRDWGVVVDLEGWRRGSRLFTMKHVLDVIARQRSLNFTPGTQYSYSNSGYNLAAIIVERVSGKPFPEFTRERIFVPQGMTHSSWRDSYTRVVKGRATAYDPAEGGGFESDMDIENIYGNCCLLTTVGDLLKFKPLDEQKVAMKLASGSAIDYALGLSVRGSDYYHSGATAGYRAFLSHDNASDTTVAVLCNRGDATTGTFIEKVFTAFGVGQPPLPKPVGDAHAPEGLYRDMTTNAIIYISGDRAGVRKGSGPKLVPIGDNTFQIGRTVRMRFDDAGMHLNTGHKPEALYKRVEPATNLKLSDYAGTYMSDEARATYTIAVDGDHLVARLPPVREASLTPTYTDGFEIQGDLLHFTRDAKGRVDGFDAKAAFSPVEGSARVERLSFKKTK